MSRRAARAAGNCRSTKRLFEPQGLPFGSLVYVELPTGSDV